jgi:hypothetical protein
LDESLKAIDNTRRLLDEAIVALDSGDDEQLAHAYERATECAGQVARAIWFLRRVALERAASAGTTDGAVSPAAASNGIAAAGAS